MHRIFLIVVAILLMVMAGWISFGKSGQTATMQLHGDEIRKDSQVLLEKGQELVESIEKRSDVKPASEASSESGELKETSEQ